MKLNIRKNFPKNLLPLTKVRGLFGDFSLTEKFFRIFGNDLTLKGEVFNVPDIKKMIGVSLIIALILFTNLRVNSEDLNSNFSQDISQTAMQNTDQQENNSSVSETTITTIDTSQNTVAQTTDDQRLINIPENNMANISENNTPDIPGLNITKDNESYSNQSTINYTNNNSVYNLNDSENFSINQSQTNSGIMIDNNSIENDANKNNSPYFYVPIDSPAGAGEIENINDSNNISLKMINISLSKDGKKEIEGEIPENFDINNIIKEEKIINENWTKQVTIKSKNHLESPLEVYTDIQKIAADKKGEITVFWVNENRTIKPNNFYDTDEDRLIDRVSWTVPHLSDQIFEISIDFKIDNISSEISLGVISAPNGTAINPISFKFSISYEHPKNLNCTLFIGDSLYLLDLNIFNKTDFPYNLANGNYNWYLKCTDGNQTKQTEMANFIINESFSMNLNQKVYLLGEPVLIQLNSNNNINATLNIYSPTGLDNKTFQVYNNSNNYILNIGGGNFTKEGVYQIEAVYNTLAEPFLLNANLSILNPQISLDKVNAKVGENIKIYTNLSSPIEKITSIIIDFGDGTSNLTYFNINESNKSIEFMHRYNQENNYTIKLDAIIGGRNFEIQKNGISISRNLSIDLERPSISLIYPDEGLILNTSAITFSYSAKDNIKLANCTFEIYNNTGILGVLIYNKTEINPDNNTRNIAMPGMNEGYYSWIVECLDNSTNSQYASRNFRINFQSQNNSTTASISSTSTISTNNNLNYSNQRVNDLLSNLKSFLTKQDSYNPDQKQAMYDLGISKDLDYYNKRLVQIGQDLSSNVNYIKDNSAREARVQALSDEMENISQKIPSDIEVIDKSEFVKNSISNDFVSILGNYLKYKNITVSNIQIKDLAEKNYNIQNYLAVSTKVKQVRIKYNGSEKEITLITKKIDLKNTSFNKILEIVPKEVYENPENIVFMNKKAQSGDSIFEISPEDLIDNETIYYIGGFIDLKKIEKTDTLLYKEFPKKNTGITGFSIFDINSSIKNSLYYSIILFLIFGFLVFLAISKKVKIALWKKDEKVIKIFNLIKDAKRNLTAKNLISAKEKYHEIKDIYPAIPSGCKKYIYKNIENIRTEIDKKDISNMIKEYSEAKKQGMDNDAKLIYENIKISYKKLPKKYQKKVYQKLFENNLD